MHTKATTIEEEDALIRLAAQNRPGARERLLADMEPALRFAVRRLAHGADGEDYLQQARLGVLRALETYDPGRGTRFWTYARWWVRSYVMEYYWRNRHIVVSDASRAARRVRANLPRVESELGEAAPVEVLAGALDVSAEDLRRIRSAMRSRDTSYDTAPGSLLAAAASTDAEDETLARVTQHRQLELLRKALPKLPARDRRILERRYMQSRPETLNEIGSSLGISRERVRQLSERAVQRLTEILRAAGEIEPDPRDRGAPFGRAARE